ncbi:SIS domain-containing protein [Actinomycetospora cinnamomea]|uniref:D-sedoheptulose 7-phosphate isomerase n=1 Tax=Actinomycetospora cinnamomea TaxID=663609 RepID=A0A2U1FI38_9PSEU|nr:SIS domain-containing protein [Actinomycetospora cinnamomea]PVZ11846.1 D-sedoheptulose 7-phosphate isomerase [Actinomycetospora cinnamomea]
MTGVRTPTAQDALDAVARRRAATTALSRDAERIAAACRDVAVRFARGGRLLTFGNGPAAADAAHLAVEFVHPVIVGKRALPALSLVADPAVVTGLARRAGTADTVAASLRAHARPEDVAIGLSADGDCADVAHGLAEARDRGLLTVALVGGDGGAVGALPGLDHVLRVCSPDPAVVRELHVTIYHVLWELVHVFLEHPGALPLAAAR